MHCGGDLQSFYNRLGWPRGVTEGGEDYLGLEIHAEKDTARVTQSKYAARIVERHGYHNANPASTPLPANFTASDTIL